MYHSNAPEAQHILEEESWNATDLSQKFWFRILIIFFIHCVSAWDGSFLKSPWWKNAVVGYAVKVLRNSCSSGSRSSIITNIIICLYNTKSLEHIHIFVWRSKETYFASMILVLCCCKHNLHNQTNVILITN